MDSTAFSLGEQLDKQKVKYILHKSLWDKFDYPHLDLNFNNWTSIKYLNADATNFGNDIEVVPNNKGGLYLFYVKCDILSGISEFPFYIGRAQLTDNQNLRKRVKEYFQKYSNNDERPKIYRMIHYWGKELYLAFYPLDDNEEIKNIERDIINSLVLPMNDLIPDKVIKQAIKAFE
ncbi:hypothetical protein HB364_04720 [Pseudoflavitalea sp. X16]|uniref:hypothetical protein n=1 Tax=Paraflavitalea devenefica TaxID=2716334 RepID=UPI00141DCEDA|nr:hypothetical protein [Paraflavitalea devenefica]NII24366.1 hypothetical protein [Paraflavitalea devenefica]